MTAMTTFNTLPARTVTVTIPAASFAADARRHADKAAQYAQEAADAYREAVRRSQFVPEGWTTPGGADVATVLRLMHMDATEAAHAAQEADEYARAAESCREAYAASRCEHTARTFKASAEYDRGTVVRYLAHLPRSADEATV